MSGGHYDYQYNRLNSLADFVREHIDTVIIRRK
jgi:hypothetical protein